MPAGQDAKEGLEEGADRHHHGPRAARGEHGGHTGGWPNRLRTGNETAFLIFGISLQLGSISEIRSYKQL